MPFVEVDMDKEAEELNKLMQDPKIAEYVEKLNAEYEFKKAVRLAREKKQITRSDICKKTGLTPQAVSRIEASRSISPGVSNLIKYLSAIDYEIVIQPRKNKN